MLCAAFSTCTVGYAFAMTFTLNPAHTTLGPGDDAADRAHLCKIVHVLTDVRRLTDKWSLETAPAEDVTHHSGSTLGAPLWARRGGFRASSHVARRRSPPKRLTAYWPLLECLPRYEGSYAARATDAEDGLGRDCERACPLAS